MDLHASARGMQDKSFDPVTAGVTISRLLSMEESEFVSLLKDSGWGDRAISIELENLRAYRDSFAPVNRQEEPEVIKEDEWTAAAMRRRKKTDESY